MMLEILLLAASHGAIDGASTCDHGPEPHAVGVSVRNEPYLPQMSSIGGVPTLNRWTPGSTVSFQFESLSALPANYQAGSQPRVACNVAMQTWNGLADITLVDAGQTTGLTAIPDGINAVTFTDPIIDGFGALAAAFVLRDATGAIIESDIVFATTFPFDTTATSTGAYDVQSVAAHEFGHALGLDHSAVIGSTMYPFVSQNDLENRSPERDDIAGINLLYPRSGFVAATGSISGNVTIGAGTQPVVGAHVVARDAVSGTTSAGTLSDSGGNYTISGLKPGIYEVYAEPLDGPVTQANLVGPIWGLLTVNTIFVETPVITTDVEPGAVAQVDLLATGTPNANIQTVGALFAAGGALPGIVNGPIRVNRPAAGQPPFVGNLYLTGAGINPGGVALPAGPPVTIPGRGITVTGPIGGGVNPASGLAYATYSVSLTSEAAPGLHDIEANTFAVVGGGGTGGLVRFCGGFEIVDSPPAAQAYSYGAGCAGAGGTPLALVPFGTPTIGGTYSLLASVVPSGQTAYLSNSAYAGIGPVIVGNCTTLINVNPLYLLPSPYDIMPGVNIGGTWLFDLSAGLTNPALVGLEFNSQAVTVDNATGAIVATSNGVKTVVY